MSDTAISETEVITTSSLKTETIKRMSLVKALFDNEQTFDIHSQTDLEYIADLLKRMKRELKIIVQDRSDLTSPLETAKKTIIAEFQPFQDKCSVIERKCKAAMNTYLNEQTRIRKLAEAAAEEKARKERDRLAARAEKAANKGHAEKAEELEALAMSTQAAPVMRETKTAGVSGREVWSAEITDKQAFVTAAINNPMLMSMINVDGKKLNQMAVMMKEEFHVPGAEAKSARSLSIRS